MAAKKVFSPGDKVTIHSTPFLGHDKQTYHLFSFYTGGRGWEGFHHIATATPTILTGTYMEQVGRGAQVLHRVALDEKSAGVHGTEFSKRPYVSKKTMQPGPHINEFAQKSELKNHYSVGMGTISKVLVKSAVISK